MTSTRPGVSTTSPVIRGAGRRVLLAAPNDPFLRLSGGDRRGTCTSAWPPTRHSIDWWKVASTGDERACPHHKTRLPLAGISPDRSSANAPLMRCARSDSTPLSPGHSTSCPRPGADGHTASLFPVSSALHADPVARPAQRDRPVQPHSGDLRSLHRAFPQVSSRWPASRRAPSPGRRRRRPAAAHIRATRSLVVDRSAAPTPYPVPLRSTTVLDHAPSRRRPGVTRCYGHLAIPSVEECG